MTRFGEVLKAERRRQRKTLAEVADHLGVSVAYLSDVERGNRPPLTPKRLRDAAHFLGIDVAVLEVAATATRGVFEFDAEAASDRAIEVGAALARKLPHMTDDTLERLLEEFLRED